MKYFAIYNATAVADCLEDKFNDDKDDFLERLQVVQATLWESFGGGG